MRNCVNELFVEGTCNVFGVNVCVVFECYGVVLSARNIRVLYANVALSAIKVFFYLSGMYTVTGCAFKKHAATVNKRIKFLG